MRRLEKKPGTPGFQPHAGRIKIFCGRRFPTPVLNKQQIINHTSPQVFYCFLSENEFTQK